MDRLSALKTQLIGEPTQVCLLAASNGNHYNSAVIGSNPKFRVNLLTRRPEIFADRRVKGIYEADKSTIEGRLHLVSADPAVVCKGTKVFIVSSPVNAQEEILRSIKPFVERGAIIGSVYGQGGFDLIAQSVFGEDLRAKNLTIFALFNIPSTCKTLVPGREVTIIGPKKFLSVSCLPRSRVIQVQHLCIDLWRVPCTITPNFLSVMMTPGNQIIHSGRLLGLYENRQARPLKEVPYFYSSLNQASADNMERLSDEIQLIKREILRRFPAFDLDAVQPLKDRIISQYGEQVKDRSNTWSVFTSNTGYRVMTVPMVQDGNNDFVLNTKARTFVEDIPFGLVVLKDLAELVQVEVPFITECIVWHQQMMGKDYVVDGKLNRALIHETGAPSKYGFDSIDKLIAHYST
jgi:NAD/NADP octopine/nopaline dehydrogenase, alpha-helical domain